MLKRLILLSLLVSLVAVAPALAQEYRGNLYITVVTEDGNQPVIGAKVTLSGLGAGRTNETNDRGEVRFIKLDPGSYEVQVEKDGFNTVIHKGVKINSFANTNYPITLQQTEVVEEVVVTARTPVMDKRKTGTATVINPEEISQIPTSRDPWAVLSTIPGIQTDRINVGGNQSGQQSGFGAKGDDGDNVTWVMDGIEFTDLAAQGGSSTYFDFNSFQEIGFVTGAGGDLEQVNPGVRLSFTTKQGTNRHSGSIGLLLTDDSFQDSTADLTGPEGDAVRSNEIGQVFEKTFDFGGPIIADQAFYWVGFSQNDIEVLLPGPSGTQVSDRTQLQNITAKLSGTIGGETTLKGFYTRGDKIKIGRNAGPTRPQPTSWNQSGPTPIYTFDISHFFTQDVEISGQYSHVGGGFQLIPQGTTGQVRWDNSFIWQDTYLDYVTERPTDIYAVRGNWFAGTGNVNHEVKFGYKYKEGEVQSFTGWGTQDTIAVEWAGEAWLFRQGSAAVKQEYTSAWVGDTLLIGNWTVNAGVTYMEQTGVQLGSTSRANGVCPTCLPELTFTGFNPNVSWEDTLFRGGITYTLEGAHRNLFGLSYSEYVDQFAFVDVGFNHVMNPSEIDYLWNDGVGGPADGNVQFAEIDFVTGPIYVGNVDPLNPGQASTPVDHIDPNYESPQVEEIIARWEMEVAKDFTVGINATTRERDNTIWNPIANLLTPDPNDWINGSFWGPATTINDTIQCVGSDPCEIDEGAPFTAQSYVLGAAGVAQTNSARAQVRTNRPGFTEEYEGVELVASKRLSNNWMFRGFIAYNDWTKSITCSALDPATGACATGPGIQSPANLVGDTTKDGSWVIASSGTSSGGFSNAFFGTAEWQYNLNGLVQLPKNFSLGANIQGREGYVLPLFFRQDEFAGDGILDRQNLQVQDVDSVRLDDIHIVDVRFSHLVQLGDTTVDLSFEVFNLFDDDTILQLQRRHGNNLGRIHEVLSPRIYRLGARVQFK